MNTSGSELDKKTKAFYIDFTHGRQFQRIYFCFFGRSGLDPLHSEWTRVQLQSADTLELFVIFNGLVHLWSGSGNHRCILCWVRMFSFLKTYSVPNKPAFFYSFIDYTSTSMCRHCVVFEYSFCVCETELSCEIRHFSEGIRQ